MDSEKLLLELLEKHLVKHEVITKEVYEGYKDQKELDFYLLKKAKHYINGSELVYEYIKVMKDDISEKSLLLLLENKTRIIEKKVGCLYAFMILILVLAGIFIMLFIISSFN